MSSFFTILAQHWDINDKFAFYFSTRQLVILHLDQHRRFLRGFPEVLWKQAHLLELKATSRSCLPTSLLHFKWDKAQVCQTESSRDGFIREGWGRRRCRRRLLWIRREILPVADSGGANSSTKDSQTGGQPASLSRLFESGFVLLCLASALRAFSCFPVGFCLSLFFLSPRLPVPVIRCWTWRQGNLLLQL